MKPRTVTLPKGAFADLIATLNKDIPNDEDRPDRRGGRLARTIRNALARPPVGRVRTALAVEADAITASASDRLPSTASAPPPDAKLRCASSAGRRRRPRLSLSEARPIVLLAPTPSAKGYRPDRRFPDRSESQPGGSGHFIAWASGAAFLPRNGVVPSPAS
jgi:hypothetical protein